MKKTIVGEIVPGQPLRILSEEVDLPYEEKLLEVLESDIVEPEEVEVIYRMGVTTPLALAGSYLVCSEGEEDARDGDLVVVTLDGSVHLARLAIRRGKRRLIDPELQGDFKIIAVVILMTRP
jgi:hypothetical protein